MSDPTPPAEDPRPSGPRHAAPDSSPSWQAYSKAITAFLVGALGALGTASATPGGFTTQALIGALISGLVAAGAVYQVPNKVQSPSDDDSPAG